MKSVSKIDRNASIYLTGSYARDEGTHQSDIDYLVFSNQKIIAKQLKRSFKTYTFDDYRILDCKIIDQREYSRLKNEKFTFIYSQMKYSVHIYGKPIFINLKPIHRKIEYDRLVKEKAEILDLVKNHKEFYKASFLLFNWIKFYVFYKKVFDPGNNITIKSVLRKGKFMVFLGQIYNSVFPKEPISDGFRRKIIFPPNPKKPNWSILKEILNIEIVNKIK